MQRTNIKKSESAPKRMAGEFLHKDQVPKKINLIRKVVFRPNVTNSFLRG